MILDDSMLPRIKRQIPQMADLLQAEQGYLDVILNTAEWLGNRMILIREDVMNIPNLKEKIKQITGWNCEILEDPEHLTITIRYYFDALEPVLEQEERILMYIPAHLKVIHDFLQKYAFFQHMHVGNVCYTHSKFLSYPEEKNEQ